MKKTLEAYFGEYYGSPKKVTADCRVEKGSFAIADAKACMDCKTWPADSETECDKVVAFIDSGETDVLVLELESFLDEYNGLKALQSGKKCDLLMISKNKVVFCDMTCSNPKYIGEFDTSCGEHKIGKRLTARSQIANSINLLCRVPKVAAELDKRIVKAALFAYREKNTDSLSGFDSKVVSNMKSFGIIQEKNLDEKLMLDIGNGFTFTEVKYPSVFEW